MKSIWLINPAAMPPDREMRIQTLKRAQYLQEFGYDVTIIGGSFLHNSDINLITDDKKYLEATYDGIKYIHIRTRSYSGNGIKRFFNLLEFHFRLFHFYKKFDKPDVISHYATVPFSNIVYYIAKKLGAKYIVDIVDLWPESFVAFGLISKKNPFTQFAYWAEKWLYKKADILVFSMEGGKNYLIEKSWDKASGGPIDLNKVHYINNGVDLADFDHNKVRYKIEDPDLENDQIFKVIYLGSIRLANDLKQLIDAAMLLKENSHIQFYIYGDGPDRVILENFCKVNLLTNVKFKQKWIDIKYVPYVLTQSSLNILNYKKNEIIRFGGSQSKSFQYMASGKPICSNLKMGYCPITKYNIGIAKEFESPAEYAAAILSFAEMNEIDYKAVCQRARKAAENYDYKKLTLEFEKLLH